MTPQDRIDTGFAPWSLMTPDPAKARATRPQVQSAAMVHEDKRAPEMPADDGYMFGEDGLTFGDMLDIVNPLQHLPVIGAIYRSITGDEAEPGAKLAGGAIYGGPIGFASAMLNNAIEEHSGDDVLGHMLAMVGLGDESEDTVVDGVALAEGSPSGPAVAPGTVPVGAEAQLVANAVANANPLQLDPAQAAFLERLAGRASGSAGQSNAAGAIQPDQDAETLDDLLNSAQTAAATPAAGSPGKAKDFGGFARISSEMAQHLAMLAQAGSPSQALAQQAQASQTGDRTAGTRDVSNQADMRTASAKYSAALPLSIDGTAPPSNPFAALEAKQNRQDPFETAMNRLGLNPPTVKTRGGENTQSELMKAAFPGAAPQTASMAAAAGITPPPGGAAIPSAMVDALNRYQTMKQQG